MRLCSLYLDTVLVLMAVLHSFMGYSVLTDFETMAVGIFHPSAVMAIVSSIIGRYDVLPENAVL